jgi:hypothetical protein
MFPRLVLDHCCEKSVSLELTRLVVTFAEHEQRPPWFLDRLTCRTHSGFSFSVPMNRSLQPSPSGAPDEGGELSMPTTYIAIVIVPHGKTARQCSLKTHRNVAPLIGFICDKANPRKSVTPRTDQVGRGSRTLHYCAHTADTIGSGVGWSVGRRSEALA